MPTKKAAKKAPTRAEVRDLRYQLVLAHNSADFHEGQRVAAERELREIRDHVRALMSACGAVLRDDSHE